MPAPNFPQDPLLSTGGPDPILHRRDTDAHGPGGRRRRTGGWRFGPRVPPGWRVAVAEGAGASGPEGFPEAADGFHDSAARSARGGRFGPVAPAGHAGHARPGRGGHGGGGGARPAAGRARAGG